MRMIFWAVAVIAGILGCDVALAEDEMGYVVAVAGDWKCHDRLLEKGVVLQAGDTVTCERDLKNRSSDPAITVALFNKKNIQRICTGERVEFTVPVSGEKIEPFWKRLSLQVAKMLRRDPDRLESTMGRGGDPFPATVIVPKGGVRRRFEEFCRDYALRNPGIAVTAGGESSGSSQVVPLADYPGDQPLPGIYTVELIDQDKGRVIIHGTLMLVVLAAKFESVSAACAEVEKSSGLSASTSNMALTRLRRATLEALAQ